MTMHFHRVWRTLFVSSLAVLAAAAAAAEVTLPSLFGDHMVIQQGKKARVWGTAAPNEPVTVKLGDRENATVADDQGLWSVRIDPPAAGGPYELTVSAPSGSRTIQDVLVGEVWVCSGQSNMQWPLSRAANPEQEVAQATDPQIRLFKVEMTVAAEPQDSVAGQWAVCAPEVAKDFSAVGYFFGRELRKELNVPVGLIQSAWAARRRSPGPPARPWNRAGISPRSSSASKPT
jgi:sialate O-acetylesterase